MIVIYFVEIVECRGGCLLGLCVCNSELGDIILISDNLSFKNNNTVGSGKEY